MPLVWLAPTLKESGTRRVVQILNASALDPVRRLSPAQLSEADLNEAARAADTREVKEQWLPGV